MTVTPIIFGHWVDQNGRHFCIVSFDETTQQVVNLRVSGPPPILRIVARRRRSEDINKSRHCCYLLRSINPTYSRRTYIGYTVNPSRRIRQHNGEITGGAKRTRKARPWKMVCYIEGFDIERSALQYEWVNNHPSRIFVDPQSYKKGEKKKATRWGVNGRITTLAKTLL